MKKTINKTVVVSAITFCVFVGFCFVAFAADGIKYNLLAPFGTTKTVSTFSGYLVGAIPFILRMAAVFAVIQIVIGGFQYALSEAMGTKQDAKDRMTQAMIGLVLALTSYLILNTINPNLVNLKIGVQPIRIEGTKIICPTSDGSPCPTNQAAP